MIIARLRGGLGNQLFQYAAAKALSLHHRTTLKLDLYTYSRHRYRKFELSKFRIEAAEASREEVHRYTGTNPVSRYLNKRENYFHCPKVFAQPHYHFFEDFFALPPDIYLSGYWQSEKHFLSFATTIREQFQPVAPLDERNVELQARMRSQNSVAIHIRRGDYTSSSYSSFFSILSKSYYDLAIATIGALRRSPVLYFFSDDPDWCSRNFDIAGAEFVRHNEGDNSYKDMLLMSACRHNIIANSTFSWWGAWLNDNPEKVVIAPKQWFRVDYLDRPEPVYPSRLYNTKDLLPEKWLRL
jgi:hypothetical protein